MQVCFRHRNTGRVERHNVEREIRFVRQIGDGGVPGPITGVWIDNKFVAYTEDDLVPALKFPEGGDGIASNFEGID